MLNKSPFFVRLLHWEYWPAYITQIPVLLFWLVAALKTRRAGFFAIVNPAIETGGLFGESKINILEKIPPKFLPKTLFIHQENKEMDFILAQLRSNGIHFPIILKPNVGERGLAVEKIEDETYLKSHIQKVNYDFIIQSYLYEPLELSVLCYKLPLKKKYAITSICEKEFLHIIGDDVSTFGELVRNKPRALLQQKALYAKYKPQWQEVIPDGKKLYIQPIGNHSRGTKFLNANHQIDEQLTQLFISILDEMEGIHYGRFDLRTESWEALRNGQFKVMEFNGVGSEPAHIYHPGYSIIQAYKDIWQHWRIMQAIYWEQRRLGYEGMTLRELLAAFKHYRTYIKSVQSN